MGIPPFAISFSGKRCRSRYCGNHQLRSTTVVSLKIRLAGALLAAVSALSGFSVPAHAKDVELLNVSYDPTRELYDEYNKAFAAYWLKKTGDKVSIKQSHGG